MGQRPKCCDQTPCGGGPATSYLLQHVLVLVSVLVVVLLPGQKKKKLGKAAMWVYTADTAVARQPT